MYIHMYLLANFTFFRRSGKPLRLERAVPHSKMSSLTKSFNNSKLLKKLSKYTWQF